METEASFPTGAPGDRRTSPTLSDYARSVRRRKAIVAAGLVAGLVLGLVVFPLVLPSNPDFNASTQLDVRPLTLQADGQGGDGSVEPEASALTPDIAAAQTAIDALGQRARQLRVLRGRERSRWATRLAGAIRSSSIPGTSQVQVTFADDDPALATDALQAYVDAYAARRNGFYDRQVREVIATLRREARSLQNEVLKWSRRADAERGANGTRPPSTVTSTQLELAKERYAAITAQIDTVRQTAARNQNPTRVLDQVSAVPAENPGNAGVALALGLLLGIMGGVGLAFLAEAIAPKVVTPTDVHAATGLGVLANVPRPPRRRRRRGSGIVVVDRPFSPAAEGYRRLGTALERQGLGGDIGVLAVVSADPGDGKSLLAVNLAHSLARQGRGVILVSSDLRRPKIEKLLGLQQKAGLAEVLQDDPLPALGLLVSINDHLLALPAGQPTKHPSELLASRRLGETIQKLRQVGIVILDTPPARLSADAVALSSVADATLLVARSGVTRMVSLREAASGLRSNRIRQFGVALVGTRSPRFRSLRHGDDYREQQPTAEPPGTRPEATAIGAPRPLQLNPPSSPGRSANGKGEQPAAEAAEPERSARE